MRRDNAWPLTRLPGHFQALTAYGEEEWKTSDGSKPKYNHAQWIAKPRSNKDAVSATPPVITDP